MLFTRPGVLLGSRYLLQQRIGAGGMGEVWRAEDTMLRRIVALKVLHAALSDDERFGQRFVEEARTVAALHAPGVVEVFDIRAERDEHGEAITYLVMQYLEGPSLHAVIERHAPMPAHRALPLLAQIADALEAAHRVGIVHRDVKPANIIIDAKGAPTVLDFGIALRRDSAALTATGTVLGTVGYASPEQLRGEALTGASDLYSLGVIAYECLSGARPFDRNSPAAVITGHLHEAPPPLPAGVPSAVAELIDWTMAKDPEDRPASAAMFAQECRVAAAHAKPVSPPEPNRTTVDLLVSSSPPRSTAPMPAAVAPEPPQPRQRRGRGVLLGLAAVVAAVAVTLGAMQFFGEDEPEGQSANADPTGGASSSPEAEDSEAATSAAPAGTPPAAPGTGPLVNAASGDCLLGYADAAAPSTAMGACGEDGIDEFAFAAEGEALRISATDTGADGEPLGCIEWDAEQLGFAAGCDGTTWEFTYVRTDDAEQADFWKVRAEGGGNFCLAAVEGAPTLSPCNEGDEQQEWRTAAE
ncbi:serine/threonine-protein kinase [Glycomyces algeriensis]|uniref:serine/threonine-protein kinase n=1 Tax=Glycomyces algeriensis TaxID=256037 RepID=UPI0022CFD97B|nr:serine/threonine-protein kinase [Glycomyces algeriensis]MDA1368968.1 protein kinase [Glycomyces algeriensis]MDR7353289.1 serine/threonine-protein kinase [Glycomyces algeriensis]